MSSERETPQGFLINAAEYLERQTTTEDMQHWANVYNAQNYRRCAAYIDTLESTVSEQAVEIERLREALEWYGDEAIYRQHPAMLPGKTMASIDGGSTARNALRDREKNDDL